MHGQPRGLGLNARPNALARPLARPRCGGHCVNGWMMRHSASRRHTQHGNKSATLRSDGGAHTCGLEHEPQVFASPSGSRPPAPRLPRGILVPAPATSLADALNASLLSLWLNPTIPRFSRVPGVGAPPCAWRLWALPTPDLSPDNQPGKHGSTASTLHVGVALGLHCPSGHSPQHSPESGDLLGQVGLLRDARDARKRPRRRLHRKADPGPVSAVAKRELERPSRPEVRFRPRNSPARSRKKRA